MEPSLTLDDMINNPDILLSAVNETFANDMTQQYYTPQTPSTYIPQPVQQMPQKQQSKTQVIEVFLKELNELRSRVKKLEDLSQQRAQQQTLEIPPIQIPIRLDIMTNDQKTSQNVGVGKATKKLFCFCCFTSQVNIYGHCGTVSSPNNTFSWAGLNKQLTSNSCTYFRL